MFSPRSFQNFSILRQQPIERTAERFAETKSGGEQHIDFAGFDALEVADVQIGEFRELLLCQVTSQAFATNISSQLLQPGRNRFYL